MSNQWIQQGDRGSGVRRVQELLLSAGIHLPAWGADGDFGSETLDGVLSFQRRAGLDADGVVGPATMAALHKAVGDATPNSVMRIINGVEVYDYRGQLAAPKNGKPEWGNRWPKFRGVVLHRTACRLGENPARYFRVNAHMHVTLGGRIILCHPWDMHIWHGHKMSLWGLGIEIDGNPEGFPGYHWKPGGGPDDVTDAQVKACDVLLDLLLEEFKVNGRPFDRVWAHRQGSENRECDPGWQAWQKIAVPWMERTGALPGDAGRQGDTYGTGFQIPQSWDPTSPTKGFRER
ncbi:MAG: hypothetical protein GY838_13210 [bacterium]|nr:hypothetical protein [bacterium]